MTLCRRVVAGGLALVGTLALATAAVGAVPGVRWHRCAASWKMPRGWVCARYPVPRNYARPRAGMLWVAVAKLPAANRAKRRGSVFFNPGGPGGAGLELASN